MTRVQRRNHQDNPKIIGENTALSSNEKPSKDLITKFEALYHRRSGAEIAADADRLAATAKRFRQEQMLIRKRQQRRQILFLALLAVLTWLVARLCYWP
jgi:hypothetical protein